MPGDDKTHPTRPTMPDLERQLEESNASELMADEMLANAMAHGEDVDLDRLHEESLAAAAEIEERRRVERKE
jgi:hypothetical protein